MGRGSQIEAGENEGGPEFGDKFLGSIGLGAEALGEITVEAVGRSRPVNQLMSQGRGVAVRRPEVVAGGY